MRCETHCPAKARGAAGAAVAAAVAVYVLWQLAVVLAVTAGLAVVIVVGLAWASRRYARRLSVLTWPAPRVNTRAVAAVNIRAVAAPARELAAPPRVLEGVIISRKEEAESWDGR